MKLLGRLLAVMVAFMLTPATFASAEVDEPDRFASYGKGIVQTGHPSSFVIGVTEAEFRVNRCSATLASQGVDALVAEIGNPNWFSVRAYLLGITSPAALAPYTGLYSNQSFYSSTCTWLSTAYMRPNKSLTQVPEGAKWAVVAFPYGSRIGLEWKAGESTGDCAFGY